MPDPIQSAPVERGVETICGAPMPDRLWLVDMGSGDVSWSGERNPDGEQPLEAVEYVRAALSASTPDMPGERVEQPVSGSVEVHQALLRSHQVLEQIAHHRSTNFGDVDQCVLANRAALASLSASQSEVAPAPAQADDSAAAGEVKRQSWRHVSPEQLVSAADVLCIAAQTTGGVAGRDGGLVAAIDAYGQQREAYRQCLRIDAIEGDGVEVGAGALDHPLRYPAKAALAFPTTAGLAPVSDEVVTPAMIAAAKRYVRGEDDAVKWAIEAALSSLTHPQPSAGEVALVPREPTEAMLEALHDTVRILVDPAERECSICNEREVWSAMLAAAPQPGAPHE